VMDAVDPLKDVDGFHPVNTGLLAQKRPRLRPCTPFGVIRLAHEYGIDLTGLRATVVGASNIVGRPMALELLLARATVTVCHTGTRDLRAELERASFRGSGSAPGPRCSTSASTAPTRGSWSGMSNSRAPLRAPAGSPRSRGAWVR